MTLENDPISITDNDFRRTFCFRTSLKQWIVESHYCRFRVWLSEEIELVYFFRAHYFF